MERGFFKINVLACAEGVFGDGDVKMIRSGNVDRVDVVAVEEFLVFDEDGGLRDVILEAVLEPGDLLVINFGQRAELNTRILHESFADYRGTAAGADDAEPNTIVGAGNRGIGARIESTRSDSRGGTAIEEFTTIHDEKASFIALNAGATTSAPFLERSSRSSSFSTQPVQPICLMVAATCASGKVPVPSVVSLPFL